MSGAIISPLNGRPTSGVVKARVDRSHDQLDRRPLLRVMKKSGPLGSPFHSDSLWISINLRHSIRSLSYAMPKVISNKARVKSYGRTAINLIVFDLNFIILWNKRKKRVFENILDILLKNWIKKYILKYIYLSNNKSLELSNIYKINFFKIYKFLYKIYYNVNVIASYYKYMKV